MVKNRRKNGDFYWVRANVTPMYDGDEISGYRQVDGVNYAATELRAALFPSEPGQLEIGPAQIQLRLRDRSRFEFFAFDAGPEKVLRTPPVPVTVLPLPDAGRPAGFKGTVAQQFSVSLKTDPGPYAVGQPITGSSRSPVMSCTNA